MKQGQIIKNAKLNKEELALINRYTRREMSEEEVYTFSVVLCDNDIDRDFERFDEQALHTLKELFVGKTGVFDHDPKAENQTARIYDCTVERIRPEKPERERITCGLLLRHTCRVRKGTRILSLRWIPASRRR